MAKKETNRTNQANRRKRKSNPKNTAAKKSSAKRTTSKSTSLSKSKQKTTPTKSSTKPASKRAKNNSKSIKTTSFEEKNDPSPVALKETKQLEERKPWASSKRKIWTSTGDPFIDYGLALLGFLEIAIGFAIAIIIGTLLSVFLAAVIFALVIIIASATTIILYSDVEKKIGAKQKQLLG